MKDPDWSLIPERMRGAIERYIEHGIPPGHFLSAVISNDLKEAIGRADDENAVILHQYVKFFYNYAPIGSWGSREDFEQWVKRGGTSGRGSAP